MRFTIKNEDIQEINNCEQEKFPKYTSQLINWANQNAQGTRPKVVGQLSELFPEYQNSADSVSIDGWASWYSQRYAGAIEKATEKIYEQVQNLQEAIQLIDREMIQRWVFDLVITKTYNGMYLQKAILSKLAEFKKLPFRLSNPEEEAVGIDGYVGDVAYSIKPDTYKTMNRLSEEICVKMIYYTKTKSGLIIEIDD